MLHLVDVIGGLIALAGKDERPNVHRGKVIWVGGVGREVCKRRHWSEMREDLVGESREKQGLEVRLPHLPLSLVKGVRTAAALRIAEQLEISPQAERILVAEGGERCPAQQVAHGTNQQHPPDQHEIAAQLQQRAEISFDIGRAGARLPSPRLYSFQVLSGEGDG